MEQKDQNRIAAGKAIQKECNAYDAVLKSSGPMTRYRAELDEVLIDATAAMQGQTGSSTGITLDKYKLEAVAIDRVVAIAGAAKSHAMDTDNNKLLAAVDWTKDALLHIPQNEGPARLRSILAAARTMTDKELEE